MKSLGLISQILTIGLSVSIALLYIRPAFEDIDQIQTDILEYKTQREKVEKVNADLARHVATLASISPTDVQRVATYMPRFVDSIAIMRDLQFIAAESGMIFKGVEYVGEGQIDSFDDELAPTPHEFSLVTEGTYSQAKDLFSLLEQNEYPLEVHSVNINPIDGGFLAVELLIVTYEDNLVLLENSI